MSAGKWTLGGCSGRMVLYADGSGEVADVDTLANAKLIAHAPAMAELLERFVALEDPKMPCPACKNVCEGHHEGCVYEQARQLLKDLQ